MSEVDVGAERARFESKRHAEVTTARARRILDGRSLRAGAGRPSGGRWNAKREQLVEAIAAEYPKSKPAERQAVLAACLRLQETQEDGVRRLDPTETAVQRAEPELEDLIKRARREKNRAATESRAPEPEPEEEPVALTAEQKRAMHDVIVELVDKDPEQSQSGIAKQVKARLDLPVSESGVLYHVQKVMGKGSAAAKNGKAPEGAAEAVPAPAATPAKKGKGRKGAVPKSPAARKPRPAAAPPPESPAPPPADAPGRGIELSGPEGSLSAQRVSDETCHLRLEADLPWELVDEFLPQLQALLLYGRRAA